MAKEFKLPSLPEGVDSATVGSILVNVGDDVASGTMVMELESDKATLPISMPFAGKVSQIPVKTGDVVKSGALVLMIDESGTGSAAAPAKPAPPKEQPAAKPAPSPTASSNGSGVKPTPAPAATAVATKPSGPIAAAPATRRLARELGVDLSAVHGTAAGGRITKEDVKSAFGSRFGGSSGAIAAPPLPDFSQFGPIERKALNAVGKAAVKNLSLAWRLAPHVTQHELADVTELEEARKTFVKASPKLPKVTMTVLAMKAVLAAVKEFPIFNASFDADASEIIIKKHYHFGIAVDTEHGLMVPVIRDVDKKTLVELAGEVSEVAEKARTKRLDPASMKGGTFTISNLGGLGGTAFTPIVNYPEVAILGLARSRHEFVLHDNQPTFRLMLPLCLSYDHRVVNGADGARFVTRLSQLLANPFAMMSQLQ
jgi:pyruvate dehydrogenase E2 component (dihydrolipoamide acetyltransferase)